MWKAVSESQDALSLPVDSFMPTHGLQHSPQGGVLTAPGEVTEISPDPGQPRNLPSGTLKVLAIYIKSPSAPLHIFNPCTERIPRKPENTRKSEFFRPSMLFMDLTVGQITDPHHCHFEPI